MVVATINAFVREGMGWMAPLAFILLVIALLLALLGSTGALAPFVYPLL
jgi:hypothetical protein